MNTPFDEHAHRKPGLFGRLRSSFLTGIVVILPVFLTIWLIWTVIGWIDGFVLPLVPNTIQPEQYVGVNLRGVGVIIFLIFIMQSKTLTDCCIILHCTNKKEIDFAL